MAPDDLIFLKADQLVIHGDDRFDRASGRIGEFIESLRDLCNIEAVGDPVLEVDFSFADDLDDFREVCRKSIPAGHD